MAPKGGNAKKESGRAKKSENESKKQEQAALEKERKEAEKWADKDVKGGKAKAEDKEEKRKADLARKAENARLLAEEEAAVSAPKPKAAAPKKTKVAPKDFKPAGPGAIAAGGGLAAAAVVDEPTDPKAQAPEEVESFAATGIDNAIDLLEIVTAKMDKASVGQQAAGIERHPERRFKAAYEAYTERELPIIRKEQPGLRLQQYKDLLYKQFQKSPENPFNQVTVAYDATKEDKHEALKGKKAEIEDRLREK
ncbi:DUF1014-domain-containing protein [Pholiota conissans]|uniref:DUF1014-domain-containing protein n=1 Tax=Pholiota conissans TaxID=109636 RepID=A0A9P5ZD54_9AGAR|nr:DUF1014-domain-containing protein [Pholiota conissans]